MADENVCETCGMDFPTSRGLNIHVSRIHAEENKGVNPNAPLDLENAKAKLLNIVARARPSAFLNILLGGAADRYGDPNIRLNSQEMADMDGAIQEVLAEVGPGYARNLAPYLPWIAVIMIAGPILLDKWSKIAAAQAAGAPAPPPEIHDKPPTVGQSPPLTRADIMPEYAGGE